MRFQVKGPFDLEKKRGIITSSPNAKNEFWESVEKQNEGLSDACGCYIFYISAGGSMLPWYVGKAERQSFRRECFSPQKINRYNDAIAGRKGKPGLFLLPQINPSGTYRKPTISVRPAIGELERLLIGFAMQRNSALTNVANTRYYRKLEIEGFFNSRNSIGGRPPKDLRKLFRR